MITPVILHMSLQRYLLEHFGLHFQGHILDNSVHTNCDLRCDLARVTLSLSAVKHMGPPNNYAPSCMVQCLCL